MKSQVSISMPKAVAFTRRAWTALLAEVYKKLSTETGGILLGYRNGDYWIVVESLDPGPNSIFQVAYFEYDQNYVTHLTNRIRNYYDPPLDILGLWHRHPGSFDQFSGTDDVTNRSFADLSPAGAISGLINIDPNPRFTLFHVSSNPLQYTRIDYTVLDDKESEEVAPLRSVDDLVARIARGERDRAAQSFGAHGIPSPVTVDIPYVSERIADAIHSNRNLTLENAYASQALSAWTAEDLNFILDAADTDLQTLNEIGVEASIGKSDEWHLELASGREGSSRDLFAFALVKLPGGNADIVCVLGEGQDPAVAPYTRSFFKDNARF